MYVLTYVCIYYYYYSYYYMYKKERALKSDENEFLPTLNAISIMCMLTLEWTEGSVMVLRERV